MALDFGMMMAPPIGGDLVGPSSATDNAIARFDGTTGKLVQNSAVTVSDTGGILAGDGLGSAPSISFVNASQTGFWTAGTYLNVSSSNVHIARISTSAVRLGSNIQFGFDSSVNPTAGLDVVLARAAANILAQRNGTAAQAFRPYNSYTDDSNYEVGLIDWIINANVFQIGTTAAGSGTGRPLRLNTRAGGVIDFYTGNGSRWQIDGSGHFITPTDNTYDIGASGATRPRTGYFGTSVVAPTHVATGVISSSGPTSGIGYATGAGGTVTQATSRSTGVTLNKVTGQITTTADSLAAITIVTFTVTNSAVAATDTIILSKVSGDADSSAWVSAVGAGSFAISLRNNDAIAADTTAYVTNFAVIKGVTS